jgi:uncharacterized protein YeaO (DUF488 family)
MIATKRVYEPPAPDDGQRILVDRLWPRGLTKAAAHVDLWLKDIAPSTALRQWAHREPDRWLEFQDRYWAELREQPEAVATLRRAIDAGKVTLLFAGKNETHNNAVALKAFLEHGPAR